MRILKKLQVGGLLAGGLLAAAACTQPASSPEPEETSPMARNLQKYAPVRLTTPMSALSENERAMIPLLIEAADSMQKIFWEEAYGDARKLLKSTLDADTRRFVEINFGPWDRLDSNAPFIDGVGPKPKGANFYPTNMTKAEFESHLQEHPGDQEAFTSLYTVIRRDDAGKLVAIPYHEFFQAPTVKAAGKLRQAAVLADDPGLKRYLTLRAAALLTDDYQSSDLAWMDMKDNGIDFVIGPIENYEDQLFGYKAAHEAYVLVKDKEWSARLSRYAALLPELQRALPVPDKYKAEEPGTDSDLNAYDVIYYAGDCNAGSKTIAINLPNDPEVQLKKGTRRLQLKNAMRAKYDKILLPISERLIHPDQREYITFDAFFGNVMFHEVAHGLGVKNVVGGEGGVREALKEQASAMEEAKADVLGLFLVTNLNESGEIQGDLRDNYTTFMASIFRSVRFGGTSAHGRANLLAFNFFQKMGAFERDPMAGHYRVNFDKMEDAVAALAGEILKYQGDGDYKGARSFLADMGVIGPALAGDLEGLAEAGIPVDVVFEQGMDVLNAPRVEPHGA